MVLIKKKKRPRQEGKGGQVNVFRVEKRSEIDSKIDLASIPDDMTIEEVLVEFFNRQISKSLLMGLSDLLLHCKGITLLKIVL